MIPSQPCQRKGAEMMEGHLMPDHVHMPAGIPPRIGVPGFMGCPKGKSALLMSGKACNLKHKLGDRKFWAEGCYVSAAGMNEATIAKHIREQEAADIALGKLGVREHEDPFGRKYAGTCPSDGHATSQAAIGPERSEGQGLESLAGIYRVIPSEQTTRYAGGHD